jgi:hypothetical protein
MDSLREGINGTVAKKEAGSLGLGTALKEKASTGPFFSSDMDITLQVYQMVVTLFEGSSLEHRTLLRHGTKDREPARPQSLKDHDKLASVH